MRIHARQIETFGGTPGIRDECLLESALAQPQATFGGQFLHSTIHEQAYHLVMQVAQGKMSKAELTTNLEQSVTGGLR